MNVCGHLSLLIMLLAVAVAAEAAEPAARPANPTTSDAEVPIVELRGRIVCVPEEIQRLHAAELPYDHSHAWGLKTTDGRIYSILRGKYSKAIDLDERLRTKELLVKARLFPKTQIIEVMHLHSVVGGAEHVLHYWCDVCAIRMLALEQCDCCQGPVRLIEKPVTDRSE